MRDTGRLSIRLQTSDASDSPAIVMADEPRAGSRHLEATEDNRRLFARKSF
jgi:hypothetical protein